MAAQNLTPRPTSGGQPDLRTRRALTRIADITYVLVPPPTTIFLDNFHETGNVNLALHTPDQSGTGNGWVSVGGPTNATVQSNDPRVKFDQGGSTGNMKWKTTQSYADITCYATVQFESAHDAFGGPSFRIQDANNMTMAVVDHINQNFAVYELIGGTFTQRAVASLTIAYATNYDVKAILAGSTITATCTNRDSGVLLATLSYNALSTNTSGTAHGVIMGGSTTSDYLFGVAPYKLTTP